jgi:methionine synthase I (cobalamin-dependent)
VNLLRELGAAGRAVLTDGALGTELQARGLAAGELPDAWNLSRPDVVEEVIRAYVDAGSDIVLTATFRANRLALAAQELDGKVVEINRAGVAIARRAAAGRARVFGSIGPSGKLLLMGDITEQQLEGAFSEQAEIMAQAGADAIVIETMSDLAEAAIAVRAAAASGLPVVASMVFDSGKNKDRTMMGATPERAAAQLEAAGAQAVGANCGVGIACYIDICRRLRAATGLPVWIKPNAGLPEMVDGRAVYRTSAEAFVAHVPALLSAGATYVGGCCGTTPDFIRAMRAVLDQRA